MTDERNPVDCFNELQKPITSIAVDQLAVLNMPYEEAMQEARRVVALVEEYKDQLSKSDIDPALLESIAARAGAFAYCVAALETNVDVGESNAERFQALKHEGYLLRKKMLSDLQYIFRKNTAVLKTLAKISLGRGDLEMIKELLSLFLICSENRDRISKTAIDQAEVERLNTLYKELFNITAQIDIDPERQSEAKMLCSKAWTYLWEALSEIYDAGKFVFSKKPEIEELFYIDYRQELGKKSHQQPTKTVPEQSEVEVTTA